jgi:AcrR family transcriptional regulator
MPETPTPDRKTKLVECLANHVLANGLGAASLRPLAAAAGTSDRMLLYYFPDKAALITAILEEIAARMVAILGAHRAPQRLAATELQARLLPLLFDAAVWPFMQVWLEIASLSARGDATCRRVGGGIARGFVAWLADQIDGADEAARIAQATRLLMTIEGAVLLQSLGLGDDVHAAMTRAQ